MTRRLSRRPLRRRVAAAWLLGALALIGATNIFLDRLRDEVAPAVPPPAAATFDALREGVECEEGPVREGEERIESMSEPSLPAVVTSGELLDCPQTWDGREVRLIGEVVGDMLRRGDVAWLQVNDDAYAVDLGPLPTHRDYRGIGGGLGVLAPFAEARTLSWIGGPRTRGDVVEVSGTFHRVDPATREVAVIRATRLEVRSAGGPVELPPVPLRRTAALSALTVAAAVLLAGRARRRP